MQDLNQFANRVLKVYEAYYDVHRDRDDLFAARMDFHMENDNYVLFKKNVTSQAMVHEYCWLLVVPHLDLESYRRAQEEALRQGMELIDPKQNHHMSTTLSLMVLCESCDRDALRALKHCNIHREFRFGLDGYMDFHTGIAVLNDDTVACNFSGGDLRRNLRNLLKAESRRLRLAQET